MFESKQRTIVPAKNIVELYANLEVYNGLSEENLAFYVPLFEDKFRRLESTLAYSNSYNDTIYLMGQTGTGKTTVVDYLFSKSERLKQKYVFLEIDFLDDKNSTDYYDTNFNSIELFLIMFSKVFSIAEKYVSKPDLEKLTQKLKAIEDKQNIQYKDTTVNQWSFADLLAEGLYKLGLGWNIDMARRETIRRLYQNSFKEILELLNELIAKTQQAFTDGKVLLLFLDGLEKLRATEVITKIFNQENADKFRQIQCRKLIVKPIDSSAQTSNTAADSNREILICTKVFHNPLDPNYNENQQQQSIIEEYRAFREIIHKRIDASAGNLIDDDALELAIQKSGGILNDYLDILKSAIIYADVAASKIVRKEHVEGTCTEFEFNKSGTFATDAKAIRLLYHILDNHSCPDDEDLSGDVFLRQMLINNIVIGKNGVRCFYVHPLIQKTVNVYGKPRTQ
jgi:Cdc6-like AAA superfamily ATPase